jgi:hypothetical protein
MVARLAIMPAFFDAFAPKSTGLPAWKGEGGWWPRRPLASPEGYLTLAMPLELPVAHVGG